MEAARFHPVGDTAAWVGLSRAERCGHSGDRHTWRLNED